MITAAMTWISIEVPIVACVESMRAIMMRPPSAVTSPIST